MILNEIFRHFRGSIEPKYIWTRTQIFWSGPNSFNLKKKVLHEPKKIWSNSTELQNLPKKGQAIEYGFKSYFSLIKSQKP